MEKRKWKRKVHNAILWIITYSAFILFMLSLFFIESDSWVPTNTLIGSLAWLSVFGTVNRERW